MTAYYSDSSILVKHHIDEAGSQWFRRIVGTQDSAISTIQISIVEVCSALNRRLREGQITANEYHHLIAQSLFLFRSKYGVMDLSEQIIEIACSILERHPLRAFDAIHLAAALTVNKRLIWRNESGLIFLAAGDRLLSAAAAEGLLTFNPAAEK
jgi:predicted nucleic acid-binding protein